MNRLTDGMIRLICAWLALLLPGWALAVCSDYHGMATINEVHRSGNATRFIEVKILSSSIPSSVYRQWTVETCVPGWIWDNCNDFPLSDASVQVSTYPWIVIPKSMLGSDDIDLTSGTGMDLILKDAQGRTIDYLSVAGVNNLRDSSCASAFADTHPGGNSHTISRIPDGTGSWAGSPGNSAGNTNGDSNDAGNITGPNLSVSNAQAAQGEILTFTLTLSALHNEPITVYYETDDGTAKKGVHYVERSGTVTIPAGQWSATVQVQSAYSSTVSDTQFYLTISQATNVRIINQVGVGTIKAPQLQCFVDQFNRTSPGDDWLVSHSSGNFGDPRIQSGRLMLTDNTTNVATLASLQRQFPARGNLVMVEFDHFAYDHYHLITGNEEGGDGVALVLSDARTEPRPGSYGGSLGYAQRTGEDGFAGGWLGIGLDEYGNFANPTEGRIDGPGLRAQSVTLRGAAASGYRWLATVLSGSSSIDFRDWWFINYSPVPGPGYRYRVWVDSRTEGQSRVTVERNTGGGYQTLIGPLNLLNLSGQAPVPDYLRLSFTGSTGDRTNYHELDNLQVCAIQLMPVQIAVDHFRIETDSTASTCTPQEVTITARDAFGAVLTGYTGTIQLSTTSGHGNWRLLEGQGFLTPAAGTSDDGRASYTFSAQDQGRIRLLLENAHADSLRIEVRDLDASVLSRSDPVQFGDNLLVIGTADSFGADLIAGRDHGFEAALWQRDPNTGQCAIATGYQGNYGLKAWLVRDAQDPGGSAPSLVGGSSSLSLPDAQPGSNNLNLTFTSGRANFALRTTDVGRFTLKLRDDSSGFAQSETGQPLPIDSTAQGAPWTVRPFALRVTAEDNPAAADASGQVYRRAGEEFRLRVAAVLYEAADDLNQDGAADSYSLLANNGTAPSFGREGAEVALSSRLLLPAAGNDPGLDLAEGLGSFVNGEASGQYRFNEVGIIEIEASINGGDYLGSPGSAKLKGASGPVGRFIPDRFLVEQQGKAQFTPQCPSNFTYLGQEFGFTLAPEFLIKPLNRHGQITQNYQGAFRKLQLSGVNTEYPDRDNDLDLQVIRQGDSIAEDGLNPGVLHYILGADDRLAYRKPATPVNAFASTIRPRVTKVEDSDGVKATHLEVSPLESQVETDHAPAQVYGRWRLENAYGPDTLALMVPFAAEYWNGVRFVVNDRDQCSTYEVPNDLSLTSSLTVSLTPTGPSQLQNGQPVPGHGLEISAPGQAGTVDLEWTVPSWLQYDWNGDGNLENPSARAQFGYYRGNDRVIYWREVAP